jgi:vacuolar-type H+-ATPase subunit E/Vma4
MADQRLIAAMQSEVAGKLAELARQTAEALGAIEARTGQQLAEAEAAQAARVEQQLVEYHHVQRLRFENQWRARLRNLQFEIAAQVWRDVEQAAAGVRQRADYPAIWRRLLAEALQVYRGEQAAPPILRVASADRLLAEAVAGEFAAIETAAAVADGVELFSVDRRLRVQNTTASRLRQGREEFLRIIAAAIRERVPC